MLGLNRGLVVMLVVMSPPPTAAQQLMLLQLAHISSFSCHQEEWVFICNEQHYDEHCYYGEVSCSASTRGGGLATKTSPRR